MLFRIKHTKIVFYFVVRPLKGFTTPPPLSNFISGSYPFSNRNVLTWIMVYTGNYSHTLINSLIHFDSHGLFLINFYIFPICQLLSLPPPPSPSPSSSY